VTKENVEFMGFGYEGFPECGRIIKLYGRFLRGIGLAHFVLTTPKFQYFPLEYRKDPQYSIK
jgi:hypothetical protein